MLPSFIRRHYDPDETTRRHAYTPLENSDEGKEFKSVVDEVEGQSSLQTEESFPIGTQRRDGLKTLLKTLSFLVPSFLEPAQNEAKPLRSTAWLGNVDHDQPFWLMGLTYCYRRSARHCRVMCRICSRRWVVVLMGHSVGMDTRPTSTMVAVSIARPTTHHLRVRSSLCVLRRVRLYHIPPLPIVGSPREVRGSRLGHRIVHLPTTHPSLSASCRDQLRHRHDDLSRLVPGSGPARRRRSD